MGNAFQDHLEQVIPGRVRALFCDAPSDLLAEIELAAPPLGEDRPLAVCRIGRLPGIDGLLSAMLHSLAEIGRALFPDWYDGETDLRAGHPLAAAEAVRAAASGRAGVSAAWLRSAAARCREGELPLPSRFGREIQAAQLALAVGGPSLCFLLSMEDPDPRQENLLGLTKATEWFTRLTGAGLLLLLPRHLFRAAPTGSLGHDAHHLESGKPAGARPAPEDEAKHAYQPVRGGPHPFSPGEQVLAGYLGKDENLAGLFTFNQPVTTVRGRRFVVDLLWPGGRAVVEVDGFTSHRSRFAFREDRNRDYELTISGYLVMRLTHEEILEDPQMAVDKIRDLVHFRKKEMNP